MKIKAGEKTSPLRLLVLGLGVIGVVVILLLFGNNGEMTQEERMQVDCIEYIRRGCCDTPDVDRCDSQAVGWEHGEDPHDVCCE